MQFSIVIPIHNEESNIGSLLSEIRLCLSDGYEYEVICVDDHSTDNSAAVIAKQCESTTNINYIRLERQSGQSCALLTGIKSAQYPLIISLDGDGQNDPADIVPFVRKYEEQCRLDPNCMLIGHRKNRRDTFWKRLTSRIANAVRRAVLSDKTADSGCGIKAFSKDLYLSLPAFDHMHRFTPALVRHCNGSVFSIPVNHRPRQSGSSHYGTLDRLKAGIVDVLGVMWLKHRALPINTTRTEENND